MKRIMLFLATNIAVILLLSIAMRLLGADQYLAQQGYNYQALLVFSAIFGLGGAFIPLGLFKWLAKRVTGPRVNGKPAGEAEADPAHEPGRDGRDECGFDAAIEHHATASSTTS